MEICCHLEGKNGTITAYLVQGVRRLVGQGVVNNVYSGRVWAPRGREAAFLGLWFFLGAMLDENGSITEHIK